METLAIKKYWTVFKFGLKASLFYRQRILAQSFLQCFRILILALVYGFVYKSVNASATITVQVAVWSIAAYFCLLSIRFRNLFEDINNDIRLGNIEVMLNRPVNYFFFRLLTQIGNDLFSFVVPVIFSLIVLPVLVGLPQVTLTPVYALGVVAVSILGLTIGALLYGVIGYFAFWMEDAKPVYWLVDKGVLLLGGSYLPIVFYPGWMQVLVYFTPFGASMFVSHIFYTDFMEKLPALVLIQIFWIAALAVFNIFVFKRARKQLTVNGG